MEHLEQIETEIEKIKRELAKDDDMPDGLTRELISTLLTLNEIYRDYIKENFYELLKKA